MRTCSSLCRVTEDVSGYGGAVGVLTLPLGETGEVGVVSDPFFEQGEEGKS